MILRDQHRLTAGRQAHDERDQATPSSGQELLGFDDPEAEAALREQLLAHIAQDRFRYPTTGWPTTYSSGTIEASTMLSWHGMHLRELHRAQAGGSVPC